MPSDPPKRIPPGNFNLSDRVYRPDEPFTPIEGLSDKVRKLHAEKRHRSALDEIFKALDQYPDHPHALFLASIVAGESRMGHLQSAEPLTQAYMLDPRIDPIFTVCSQCKKSMWVSNAYGMGAIKQLSVLNPIGQQCYHCGYVMCRDCMESIPHGLGFGTYSNTCPNCQHNELGVPVYPTGRPSMQLARHKQPIVRVLVFREGPIPPDKDYITRILEVYSPDVFENDNNNLAISAYPAFPWPQDISTTAVFVMLEMERRGDIPAGSVDNTESIQMVDEQGNHVYICKILRPSDVEIAQATAEREAVEEAFAQRQADRLLRDAHKPTHKEQSAVGGGGFLGRLFGKKREDPDAAMKAKIEDLMRRHVTRVKEQHLHLEAFVNAHPSVNSLLQSSLLTATQTAIIDLLPKSFVDHQHHWQTRRIGEFLLIVSTIPALTADEARSLFKSGYMAFLDHQLVSLIQTEQPSIAHWIWCSNGERNMVHLTFIPKDGMALIAQDLLTATEKSIIDLDQ